MWPILLPIVSLREFISQNRYIDVRFLGSPRKRDWCYTKKIWFTWWTVHWESWVGLNGSHVWPEWSEVWMLPWAICNNNFFYTIWMRFSVILNTTWDSNLLQVNVQYNITIARRSSIYRTVILAPAFVIILLTLLTFWLPPQYGEKILLNGITAIIIVLFLLYFSQKINMMASHTPLVGKG